VTQSGTLTALQRPQSLLEINVLDIEATNPNLLFAFLINAVMGRNMNFVKLLTQLLLEKQISPLKLLVQ
jgi:hypothetical protein